MDNFNNTVNVENSANANATAQANAGGGAGGGNMRVMIAGGGGALIGLAILLIVLRVILGAALFMSVLSILATGGAGLSAIGLTVWYFHWSRRRHETELLRWIQIGSQIGVSVQTATINSEAQRHLALGRVTTEALRVLKSNGAFDPVYPARLPMGSAGQQNGDVIDTSFRLTGLDDQEDWQ